MRPALALALLTALPLAITSLTPAHAQTRVLSGESLSISNGDAPLRVIIDTTLAGQVRVDMSSGLSCLAASGGATISITTQGCDSDAGQVTVFVPPSMPVALASTGSGKVVMDSTTAPVSVHQGSDATIILGDVGKLAVEGAGSGELKVDHVRGAAALAVGGDGAVRIADVTGPLALNITGSGAAVIGHISADQANVTVAASGDALIGNGRIGDLQVQSFASGDMAVSADVTDATITATGSGDVRVAHVSGKLVRNVTGTGEVKIGGNEVANAVIGAAAGIAGSLPSDHKTVVIGVHADGHSGPSWSLILLGVCGFVIYRTMKRNNAWPPRLNQWRPRAASAPAVPDNAVVRNIAESFGRLEERMMRLESFVTTREFDLHRQFRDLDRKA